jgi:uncharacterized protein (DUF608 family)
MKSSRNTTIITWYLKIHTSSSRYTIHYSLFFNRNSYEIHWTLSTDVLQLLARDWKQSICSRVRSSSTPPLYMKDNFPWIIQRATWKYT